MYFLQHHVARKDIMMKNIKNKHLFTPDNKISDEIFNETSIFFDIETTGFSPTSASLYLIGCMYRQDEYMIVEQFFAETKDEEAEVLTAFLNLLTNYETIISFNGIGFDLPFIKAKCDALQIEEHLNSCKYLDIFKAVGNIKFLLKQPNYKQKTIETFLGIHRKDTFSGGELINVYENYIKTHSNEEEHLLLLHNYEDVLGMLDLLPILTYHSILQGAYTIDSVELTPYTTFEGQQSNEFIITLQNNYTVPKRVSFQQEGFYFTMHKDCTKIRIPVYEGELKYFYANYKDYFYLPKEDIAIHKSVASFVDKEYREKAKACNCYNRKTGLFLPQTEVVMQPFFLKEHKDKISYFEFTEDFLTSELMLKRYVEHIFSYALKCKA